MSQCSDQVGLLTLPHFGIRNEIRPFGLRRGNCYICLNPGIIGHRQVEARPTAATENYRTFNEIPELPEVAGPGMALEKRPDLGGQQALAESVPAHGGAQEPTSEREYVFGARDRMDERYDMVRSVRNQRYIYIRQYMPHLIYGQYIAYMFQTPTTQVWKELYDEGKLNDAQRRFWERKAPEELYDLENDPSEVVNLVDSPAHQEVLEELRQALLAAQRIDVAELAIARERIEGVDPANLFSLATERNNRVVPGTLIFKPFIGDPLPTTPRELQQLRDDLLDVELAGLDLGEIQDVVDQVDRGPYFEEGIRPKVIEAWRAQGMSREVPFSELFPTWLRLFSRGFCGLESTVRLWKNMPGAWSEGKTFW